MTYPGTFGPTPFDDEPNTLNRSRDHQPKVENTAQAANKSKPSGSYFGNYKELRLQRFERFHEKIHDLMIELHGPQDDLDGGG